MKYDEVWSYQIDRISEYFMSRGAVSHGPICSIDNYSIENFPNEKYLVDDVAIQLIALEERSVGPISLPQTRVIITGDNDADVERVYRSFYLNFLSGGA